MGKDLDYQSPKWEKEQKKELQLFRKAKGQDITLNNLQRILKEEEEYPDLRDYGELYSNLHLKYRIIAGATYLRDPTDKQCIKYTYLSGISSIFAYLFHGNRSSEKQNDTDRQNAVLDFTLGVLQLYAVNQPLPLCIHLIDNPYIQLLLWHTDIATSLLNNADSKFNPSKPHKLWISELEKEIIQSIIQKDEDTLKKTLITRIRKYRKWPVGYSTFIDVFSIALIKLARQYGMNCEIDVIEIPKFFFDEEVCSIDTENVKLPFFEDAVEELKKMGIDWTFSGENALSGARQATTLPSCDDCRDLRRSWNQYFSETGQQGIRNLTGDRHPLE